MPKFEIAVSAYITATFDQEPTDDDVIAYLREDPEGLLLELEVNSIDKVD